MAIADDPASFASYYDRLEFFEFQDKNGAGVLQVLYKYVNRKFRNELERYRNYKIVDDIKERFMTSTMEWFKRDEEPF
jgi:hypothetical protein